MPKHYAVAKNVQHYTVEFDNVKTVDLIFDKPFDQPPMIQITGNDSGVFPAYKTNVTTTGCKIRFKTKWNGEVDVIVLQRF